MQRIIVTFPEGVGHRLALELTIEVLIRKLDVMDADDEREGDEDLEPSGDDEPDSSPICIRYGLDQSTPEGMDNTRAPFARRA